VLLTRSLQEIHDDKLVDVIERHIAAGREREVRHALPTLIEKRPNLASTLKELQKRLNKLQNPPAMITSSTGVALTCSNCGGALTKQAKNTRTVICQYCGQDADQPAGAKLTRWSTELDTQANFSVGEFFTYANARWQAIGVQLFSGSLREWDNEDHVWETNNTSYTLWWLLNDKREIAWLSDYGSSRYWSTRYIPKNPMLPSKDNENIEYGNYRLDFAAGEFSYAPAPHQKKRTWEYTRNPNSNEASKDANGNRFIYGVEASLDERGKASEYEFIRSVKISNRDIIKGIGATQSLIGIKRWQKTGYVLAGAGAASFLAGTLLDISRSQNTLLGNTTDYTFTQSVELGELRIEDVPKIVKFNSRLNEPLAKDKWAEFEVELTNTAGDVVGWYDTEFWRETGYDEGYWDESDYGDSRLIKIEEPGIYKVTGFIGETNVIRAQSIESAINQNLSNNPARLNITLTVTDNALSKKPFLFALFAGLVGGMLSLVRSKSRAAGAASLGGRMAPAAKGRRKGNRKDKSNKPRKNKRSTSKKETQKKSNRKNPTEPRHRHREGGSR